VRSFAAVRWLPLLLLLSACSETSVRALTFDRTALVTGDFDNVDVLVDDLQGEILEVVELHAYDGYIAGPALDQAVAAPELTVEALLADEGLRTLSDYHALFLPCGMRGVGEHRYDDGGPDDHLILDVDTLRRLRDAVRDGLHLYVSDWSYEWIQVVWPEAATWVGDGGLDDAQVGLAGGLEAYVVDEALAEALGRSPGDAIELRMTQSSWATPATVGDGVEVLVAADVQIEDPVSGVPRWQTDVPLAFHLADGDGRVVFTAFHHEAQVGPDGEVLLQRLLALMANRASTN